LFETFKKKYFLSSSGKIILNSFVKLSITQDAFVNILKIYQPYELMKNTPDTILNTLIHAGNVVLMIFFIG